MSNLQLVDNLYILRKVHNITQQDLSRKLNISRQAYSNYETGKRTPDLDLLIKIAQIYAISLDQLIIQVCTPAGLIKDRKGPYISAMEIDTADTIYLTREEVDVIKKYRVLSNEYKLVVDKFLNNPEK